MLRRRRRSKFIPATIYSFHEIEADYAPYSFETTLEIHTGTLHSGINKQDGVLNSRRDAETDMLRPEHEIDETHIHHLPNCTNNT
jgi:hypothetical protein